MSDDETSGGGHAVADGRAAAGTDGSAGDPAASLNGHTAALNGAGASNGNGAAPATARRRPRPGPRAAAADVDRDTYSDTYRDTGTGTSSDGASSPSWAPAWTPAGVPAGVPAPPDGPPVRPGGDTTARRPRPQTGDAADATAGDTRHADARTDSADTDTTDRASNADTADTTADSGDGMRREVDLSRFLAATEVQPGDSESRRGRRRHARATKKSTQASAEESAQGSTGSTQQLTREPEQSQPAAATAQKQDKKDRKAQKEKTKQSGKDGGSGGGHGKGWRSLVRLLVVVGIAVLAAVLLRVYVVQPYYIPSESMEPTLHGCTGCNDDRILVDKLSYRGEQPSVEDIVVFHRPPGDSAGEPVLIKRVIAQGGDTVSLRGGVVYVNGLARLDEPYVNKKCGPRPNRPLTSTTSWKVPDGDVFVMGDNRCDSHDSRAFGPIADSSVIGRAFAIYWPLKRVGSL